MIAILKTPNPSGCAIKVKKDFKPTLGYTTITILCPGSDTADEITLSMPNAAELLAALRLMVEGKQP